MDERKKQVLYISVIAGALVLAVAVTLWTTVPEVPPGPDGIPEDLKTWVICEKCGATYQMQLRQYHIQVEENKDSMMLTIPPLKCKKCGEEGIYQAAKCVKCGHIFKMGTVPDDFVDRCPKCGHSNIEAERREQALKKKE